MFVCFLRGCLYVRYMQVNIELSFLTICVHGFALGCFSYAQADNDPLYCPEDCDDKESEEMQVSTYASCRKYKKGGNMGEGNRKAFVHFCSISASPFWSN